MTASDARNRLPALSLWIGNRLSDRQAIDWVIEAFAGKKGLTSDDLVTLLGELGSKAAKSSTLASDLRATWRLFHTAAREREVHLNWYHGEQFRRAIQEGHFSFDDVRSLVDFARPRIKPSAPSSIEAFREHPDDDHSKWVTWTFKSASDSVDHGITKISSGLLSLLSVELLDAILVDALHALTSAVDVARSARWLDGSRDLTNAYVSRVASPPFRDGVRELEPQAGEEDDDDRDPDSYHDGFAPLLRLTTAAFDALVAKDVAAAKRISRFWAEHSAALFIRLQAHAGTNAVVWDGRQVADFLLRLPDPPFWRWGAYPEVAELRAARWLDLPLEDRNLLVARLLSGPKPKEFENDGVGAEALLYWRDHELARLVDNISDDLTSFSPIVSRRRITDPEFPSHVPSFEPAGSRFRVVRGARDGDASAFDGVLDSDLIGALARESRNRYFARGDNALAYVLKNRLRVVDLLAQEPDASSDIVTVWEIALSFPDQKPQDIESARASAESIISRLSALPPSIFDRIVDRICHWLDATDQSLKGLSGTDPLWLRLLPLAAQEENSRKQPADSTEVDLSSAALNVPLGHLISFYFRRCPELPASAPVPRLPEPMTQELKKLDGRARSILANRLITTLNYFWRADPTRLQNIALEPMRSNDKDGTGLWEAFAKYGPVPRASLWKVMEDAIIKRIAEGLLSREALRRLAEISIAVWCWSKASKSDHEVNVAALRSGLGLTSDEIRGAAAWQFMQMLKEHTPQEGSDADTEAHDSEPLRWPDVGLSFFSEVWPMESAVQSPQSASDFARIPTRVGPRHYSEAVRTILPFLRPFEVWDVDTAFGLHGNKDELASAHPMETLALLSSCIPKDQKPSVFRLDKILNLMVEARPDLGRDPEFRRLRQSASARH